MIITFSHPKGGVGKTTLCFNFCVWLQSKNKDFVVVDMDGQHSLTATNEIRKRNNLKSLNIITFKDEKNLSSFLQLNSNKLIITDTGGFDSALNRVAIAYSDLLITPISDAPFEQLRLASFNPLIKGIKDKANEDLKAYIVLNRVHYNYTSKTLEQIKENLSSCSEFDFFDTAIKDRSRIKFSPANGKNIIEDNTDEKAIEEMKAFFKEIKKITKEINNGKK